MITFFNDAAKQRLTECFAHAIKLGILDNLLDKLNYLSHYGEQVGNPDYLWQPSTECVLSWDFADHSLGFLVKYHYRACQSDREAGIPFKLDTMAGGMIFHPGATGPDGSLSVQLNPSDIPSFSIHT